MRKFKRLTMTLALLIMAVGGAWAENVLNIVVDGTSATIMYDGNASNKSTGVARTSVEQASILCSTCSAG